MTFTEQARETVFHQSANRPNQLLGGDRELTLAMVMICGGLTFSLASWWGVALAVSLWVASVATLQRLGKADPLMRQVYLRHIQYANFYPSKSGLHAVSVETPSAWR